MGLDGATIYVIKEQLKSVCLAARVEKITMPQRDRVVLSLSKPGFKGNLLLCCSPTTPRIQLTAEKYENPAVPPMLCMLLRKRLCGGRLAAVRQAGLDRVVFLDFECKSELGDDTTITAVVELLGRASNLIFVENGRIIDCLHRFDPREGKRFVLPDAKYELPAPTGRLDLLTDGVQKLLSRICEHGELTVAHAITASADGLSEYLASSICSRAEISAVSAVGELGDADRQALADALEHMRALILAGGTPTLIKRGGEPKDFSFTAHGQAEFTEYADYGALLDAFYSERDTAERLRALGAKLKRSTANLKKRAVRKAAARRQELIKCENREQLRIFGELIKANMHLIKPGDSVLKAVNYYAPDCAEIEIKLDTALSAVRNAQKYFKEYKKATVAAGMLNELIDKAQADIEYFESVEEELERARIAADFEQIKDELIGAGYLKNEKKRDKRQGKAAPAKYESPDGFAVYVGRNNTQNDFLTLRFAAKNDVWLHTRNTPGAHVIISTGGVAAPDTTILFAARLAAEHSGAKLGAQVPVDYTLARYVKKPSGAKPGKVIYTNQSTIFVKPQLEVRG